MQRAFNISPRPDGIPSTAVTNELAAAINSISPAARSGPAGGGVFVETLFAKISAPIDGSAFRYDAYLFGFDPIVNSPAGDLTEAMLGTLSGWLACEVWNFAELGSGSPLDTDAIIPIRQLGVRVDDGKIVGAAIGGPGGAGSKLAIITDDSLAIGWYSFQLVARTITAFNSATDLDLTDYYTATGSTLLGYNRAESGKAEHILDVGDFVEVTLDVTEDGTAIYRMNEFKFGCVA